MTELRGERAFIVLESLSADFQAHARAIAENVEPLLPPSATSRAHYRHDTDVALLEIDGGGALTAAARRSLATASCRCGLPALTPDALSETDRARFFEVYLPTYTTRTEEHGRALSALASLAATLGMRAAPPSPDPALADPRRAAPGARPGAHPPPPSATAAVATAARPPMVGATRDISTRDASTREPRSPRAGELRASSPGLSAGGEPPAHDAASPGAGRGLAASRMPSSPRASSPPRAPSPARANSPPRDGSDPGPPPIETRYLRGDSWLPARLRTLNMRGAHLASCALPRVGDAVPVAIGFRGADAVLRGEVVSTTDVESASTPGFRVAFADGGHRDLEILLRSARAAGVSLDPPPRRQAPRYPFRWPVTLGGRGDAEEAWALDISSDGLFVATEARLDGGGLPFSLADDCGEPPIEGSARPAREVTAEVATRRGLARGYGLSILALPEAMRRRYDAFVHRVAARSRRRLAVAAGPHRLAVLTGALAGAGYAVASWRAELAGAASAAGQPPPDAWIVDRSTADAADLPWAEIESHLRQVAAPRADTDGASPQAARRRADDLFRIA